VKLTGRISFRRWLNTHAVIEAKLAKITSLLGSYGSRMLYQH